MQPPAGLSSVCMTLLSHTCPPCIVPLAASLERDAFASEDVQRTADREVDFASTQTLHELQVIDAPTASGISHGSRTDVGEMADELFVDTGLQTFCVGCVDEELAAVWFEESDIV